MKKLIAATDAFDFGFQYGTRQVRKGQNADAGKWTSVLFAVLIFAYVASTIGPDIISQFQLSDNSSLQGTPEGEIFSLGGILVAAGILAGVGAMVGLRVMS